MVNVIMKYKWRVFEFLINIKYCAEWLCIFFCNLHSMTFWLVTIIFPQFTDDKNQAWELLNNLTLAT